ncbi:MAG: hypothetical protein SFV23_24165, partial [Planctomycetaceae bacterium]|nr:hypothetical protein [Planctomycetaceae bacterium]
MSETLIHDQLRSLVMKAIVIPRAYGAGPRQFEDVFRDVAELARDRRLKLSEDTDAWRTEHSGNSSLHP